MALAAFIPEGHGLGFSSTFSLRTAYLKNPVGEDAMRPGSLVTGHRGISVRIDHTDVEGRLILADALSWASERYSPTEVITFATLTTSALNSYGPFATPVHFANPLLSKKLAEASAYCGEDLHFLP